MASKWLYKGELGVAARSQFYIPVIPLLAVLRVDDPCRVVVLSIALSWNMTLPVFCHVILD